MALGLMRSLDKETTDTTLINAAPVASAWNRYHQGDKADRDWITVDSPSVSSFVLKIAPLILAKDLQDVIYGESERDTLGCCPILSV